VNASSKNGLFGPYCGILPQWSIFTLGNVATMFYKSYIENMAHIAFLYQAMAHQVLHYNDKPHLLQQQHQYKLEYQIIVSHYEPQIVSTNTHQVTWHIKSHPYEKFQLFLVFRE